MNQEEINQALDTLSGIHNSVQPLSTQYVWSDGGLTSREIPTIGSTRLFDIVLTNVSTSWRYLKLYNEPNPTVGQDVPLMTIPLKPRDTTQLHWAKGVFIRYQPSMGYAITGGIADTDQTPVGLRDVRGYITFTGD